MQFDVRMFFIIEQRRKKMAASDLAEHIIANILAFSQRNGDLLQKYSIEYYLQHFDRTNIMLLASRLPPHQSLTLADFLRTFLLHIPHPPQHTLYLALSLKKLFQNILERTPQASVTIEFSDFTNYLCEKISKEDLDVVVPARRARNTTKGQEVTEVDLNPAVIVQKVGDELPKICRDMPKKNKKLQEKKGVGKIFYSFQKQRIIAMGTLSSSIHLYDRNLKSQIQVKPKQCRQMDKQLGILSMAYCSKYHRIGAILTSGILVFWQGSDNFGTQKDIALKGRGDKVFYLNQQQKWLTVDKNTIYFWNIKEQTVQNTIRITNCASILDVCQIDHLKSICVSLMGQNDEKILAVYQQGRRKATIDLGSSACHTLHYNRPTQSIVPLGYTSLVPVYTLQGQFDAELRYVLRGHKSIITCVDSLEHQTLMVTGDDMGQIRIWQLTYMRCVQSLKLNRWLGSIKFIGNQLLYSDSRINILQLEHFAAKPAEKEVALYQYYDKNGHNLWIFTKKDARRTNISNGRIQEIFVLCKQDEEISAVVQVGDGFVAGNSRGQLMRYNSDCILKWTRQGHQGQIRQILYDSDNRLLFSLGTEGKIIAWPQRNTPNQQERKTITFKKKQINFVKVSSRYTVLLAGNVNDNQLTVWNYEVLTLLEVLEFQTSVSAVAVSNVVELIVVVTADLQVHFFRFAKKENNLQLTLLSKLDLRGEVQIEIEVGQLGTVNQILLLDTQDNTRHQCLLSTHSGVLVNLNITQLVQTSFSILVPERNKESVNILRNQREEYQNCFSQRGHKQFVSKLQCENKKKSLVNFLYAKKICRDNLYSISKLTLKQNSISVLCHEYAKIVNSNDGQIDSSLSISQPLPLKWSHNTQDNNQLKQELYETLKILDSILRNNGFEMLAKEYKLINVTPFMEMMKLSVVLPGSRNEISGPVLCDKRNKQDKEQEEPTLKALEAFKRVKMIKKISEQSMKVPAMNQEQQQAHLDRQNLLQMLSNDNYRDLISRYHIERDPALSALSLKLDQSLIIPSHSMEKKARTTKPTELMDTKRRFVDRCTMKQNTNRSNWQKQVSNLSKSVSKVIKRSTHQEWVDRSEAKNIKEILGDLNGKLRKCRQKYNRELQA